MKKRDYRTWWAKGQETANSMYHVYDFAQRFISRFGSECVGLKIYDLDLDENNSDCFLEQLWAIREKLA